jgi:hypothetical protein
MSIINNSRILGSGGAKNVVLTDRFGNTLPSTTIANNASIDLRTLSPYDWADIFLSRETSWGGATIENALIDLCVDLKSWGSSNKVPVYYPNIGNTANNHRWNLMFPFNSNSAQRQLFGGAFSHTNKGVVCTGNGCNIFYHPNQVKTQISAGAGFGFYQTTEFINPLSVGTRNFLAENAASGRSSYFAIRPSDGRVTYACQGSTLTYTPSSVPLTQIGSKLVTRVGGSIFYYVNGVLQNSGVSGYSETSGAQVFSNGYYIYGTNAFLSDNYDASIGSVYFFIDSLNSTEITEFNTIVQTFENIVRA